MNKFPSLIEICILAVAFLLPLSLDGATFFLLLGLVASLRRSWRNKKNTWAQPNWVNLGVIMLALLAALSIGVSSDKSFSVYNYIHLMGRYMLLYYLIVQNVHSARLIRRIFLALFLGTTLVCSFGFYQYFAPLDISAQDWVDQEQFPELKKRIFSTLENPNLLAGYLVLLMPLVLGGYLNEKNSYLRLGLLLLLAAQFICFLLTFSRGAWLTLPVMILVLGFVHRKRWLYLLLLLPVILWLQPSVLERISSIINPTDTSSMMRLALWQSTLAMIADHPWLGIGWGVYYQAYPQYDFFVQGETTVVHAHNMYLNLAAEIGLPGLVVFLGLYAFFAYCAYQVYRLRPGSSVHNLMLGLLAAYAGLAVMNLTDHVLFNIQLSMLFWLLSACAVAAKQTLLKG